MILLLILPFINSCKEDDSFGNETIVSQEKDTEKTEDTVEESYIPGKIRVKFSQELALQVLSAVKSTDKSTGNSTGKSAKNNSNTTKTNVKSVDNAISSLSVTELKRTFPYCGKFEKRTHKAELDRWYDITFDKSKSLTKANNDLGLVNGIDIVEYIPIIKRLDCTENNVSSPLATKNSFNISTNKDSEIYPFNDPLLKKQWTYYNDGIGTNMEKGCDINVLPVWKNFTTGNKDVIVAVIDYGIDLDHEDLADNIWINFYEKDGTPGVDDDNNGYVDDVNGYNFVQNTGSIVAGDHGTHVAGTIGAVNNNGIGVCGIAGGDKEKGIKGVRLMSCEFFEYYTDDNGDTKTKQSNPTVAIKYAADNGAVIAQNSWGHTNPTSNTTASEKEAIDYFVKYAGVDENGTQTGPMKGGVIIFSAGNDNNIYGPPGSYESTIAVAALASDYQAAYYTNYGNWVDISAPGGDAHKKHIILSTITDNKYSYYQGTSMACPHVSGVAALLISYFGGPGFTNDMLKERLLNSTNDIIYDYSDSKHKGLLGSGLVDARAAFLYGSTIAPDPVTSYSTSVASNEITLTYAVPKDEDGIVPSGIKIYYSKKEIPSEMDFSNLSDDITAITINTENNTAGDEIEYSILKLDFSTTYYFALQSYDSSDNYSALSDCFSETTEKNYPPVITYNKESPVIIHYHESTKINFTISDPENHLFTISTKNGSTAAIFSSKNITNSTTGTLSIAGDKANQGTYTFSLTATDEYGASSTLSFKYTILPNHPPTTTGTIDNIVFNGISGITTITLDDYFTDIDGESLNYNLEQSNSTITNNSISYGELKIAPSEYGNTDITVTASDYKGESCSLTFKVLARSNINPVDVYPNPVSTFLSVRPGVIMNDVTITITNTSGTQVKNINTISTGPFTPVKIDLSDTAAGVYSVKVTSSDNDEFKSSIIKL